MIFRGGSGLDLVGFDWDVCIRVRRVETLAVWWLVSL